MTQARLQQEVQTSVLARTIDTVEQQAAAVTDLLDVSGVSGQGQVYTDPMLGQNIDISV